MEDEQDLLAVRATLVRVAWRVNPSVAARHLPALRCALAAGHLGWRDAIPVIRHALWHGELHTATEQLRIMTETAGQMDARTTAELRLTVEWIFDSLREQVPTGWTMAELALRWCLDFEAVSVIIPGAKNPDQARANIRAGLLAPLTRTQHVQLAGFYERHVAAHIRGPY